MDKNTGIWSKTRDRVNVAKVAFNDRDKAIVKATNRDEVPPKEKHVQSLIRFSRDYTHPISQIWLKLEANFRKDEWLIVLKTLIVVHRLLQEGGESFLRVVRENKQSFNLRNFTDHNDTNSWEKCLFIRRYAAYLEEKAFTADLIGSDPCRYGDSMENTWKATLNEPDCKLHRDIIAIQKQVDVCLQCTSTELEAQNTVVASALTHVIKDCLSIYKTYSGGMITILEGFFKMDLEEAEKTMALYKHYADLGPKVNKYLEIGKCLPLTAQLPQLKETPPRLLISLQDYVEALKRGETPSNDLINKNMSEIPTENRVDVSLPAPVSGGESESDDDVPATGLQGLRISDTPQVSAGALPTLPPPSRSPGVLSPPPGHTMTSSASAPNPFDADPFQAAADPFAETHVPVTAPAAPQAATDPFDIFGSSTPAAQPMQPQAQAMQPASTQPPKQQPPQQAAYDPFDIFGAPPQPIPAAAPLATHPQVSIPVQQPFLQPTQQPLAFTSAPIIPQAAQPIYQSPSFAPQPAYPPTAQGNPFMQPAQPYNQVAMAFNTAAPAPPPQKKNDAFADLFATAAK